MINAQNTKKLSNDPEPVEGPSWYVYICISKAGHYYVGISPDPSRRLELHNAGRASKMAVDQGGFVLRYVSSPYESKSMARRREVQIKRWTRAKKEKLINGDWN